MVDAPARGPRPSLRSVACESSTKAASTASMNVELVAYFTPRAIVVAGGPFDHSAAADEAMDKVICPGPYSGHAAGYQPRRRMTAKSLRQLSVHTLDLRLDIVYVVLAARSSRTLARRVRPSSMQEEWISQGGAVCKTPQWTQPGGRPIVDSLADSFLNLVGSSFEFSLVPAELPFSLHCDRVDVVKRMWIRVCLRVCKLCCGRKRKLVWHVHLVLPSAKTRPLSIILYCFHHVVRSPSFFTHSSMTLPILSTSKSMQSDLDALPIVMNFDFGL